MKYDTRAARGLTRSLPLTRSHHHATNAVYVAAAQSAPLMNSRISFGLRP